MVDLLIISDDFTGALDTGVQFAQKGIGTKVLNEFRGELLHRHQECAVLVVNTDTRKLSGPEAYEKVRRVTEAAVRGGIPYIFKKTDSALRGNIGSELKAVLDASRERTLVFAPAFPKMKRITKGGIQYFEEKPIHLTEFGRDLYEPVQESRVSSIIREQYDGCIIEKKAGMELPDEGGRTEKTIIVYDAATDEELEAVARQIMERKTALMAGCAGLAGAVSKLVLFQSRPCSCRRRFFPLLVICGSVFPVTRRQICYAQRHGFERFSLKSRERTRKGLVQTEEGSCLLSKIKETLRTDAPVIIDTMGEGAEEEKNRNQEEKARLRQIIADNLGDIINRLVEAGFQRTIMVIGGDTLKSVIEKMNCSSVEPVAEIYDGTVLFYLDTKQGIIPVLSKSGGFGEEGLLVDIENTLKEKEEQLL